MSVLIEASSDGYTLMSRAACDVPYANTPSSADVRVLIIAAAAYSLKYCLVILLFFKRIKSLAWYILFSYR
jgi:hypothetical protein